jgi:replicative DNA helicase
MANQMKLPPQSLEAEQAILGAVLIDNECLNQIIEILRPEDFYKEAHGKIFQAMIDLSNLNEPTDLLTVHDYLKKKNEINAIGGISYISSLADNIPSSANVTSYAKIVRDKSILRRLIHASSDIATKGYEDSHDPNELLDFAEQSIYEISDLKTKQSFSAIKEIVKDSFKQIEEAAENGKDVSGLATHFTDFDKLTSGLQRNDLIILAARPSMGKTSLALNIAENVSIKEDASVAIFSLEMAKEQLVTRMLCSQSRIDAGKIRKGQMSDYDWPKLTKAAGFLSDAKLYIDDTPAPTVLEMRAKLRRLKKDKGLDLAVIDYLQLIKPNAAKNSNREQEISEISRSLKSLAKELSIPIIALSQLNRSLESRTNKRPMMSDLRESGAIEQDADVIMFIYRDEVYNEDSPDQGIAEIIIGKQRNGPIGTCRLAFINEYTRFEDLAFDNDPAMALPSESASPDPF